MTRKGGNRPLRGGTMSRTTLMLDPHTISKLQFLAEKLDKPMARLVRQGIDVVLEQNAELLKNWDPANTIKRDRLIPGKPPEPNEDLSNKYTMAPQENEEEEDPEVQELLTKLRNKREQRAGDMFNAEQSAKPSDEEGR